MPWKLRTNKFVYGLSYIQIPEFHDELLADRHTHLTVRVRLMCCVFIPPLLCVFHILFADGVREHLNTSWLFIYEPPMILVNFKDKYAFYYIQ